MPLTKETAQAMWRQRLLDGLANEGVDVQLTNRQLDYALRRARQLFNKHHPHKTWWFLGTVTPSRSNSFTLDTTYGVNVTDVIIKDDSRWLTTPIVAGSFELRYGVRGPSIFYEYAMADRRYEFFTGETPDWVWDKETRTLYVTNSRRLVSVSALVIREHTLEEIPVFQETDFEDLAVAHAKMLLARILGQYGNIPGATGEITTDADMLRQEAKEEIARIREMYEHQLSSYPLPRYIG